MCDPSFRLGVSRIGARPRLPRGAIGSAVARIVDVLLHDQRAILSICCRIAGVPDCEGVTLALPHLVGGEGALATIPMPLDVTEREGLRRSAGILREAMETLNSR